MVIRTAISERSGLCQMSHMLVLRCVRHITYTIEKALTRAFGHSNKENLRKAPGASAESRFLRLPPPNVSPKWNRYC